MKKLLLLFILLTSLCRGQCNYSVIPNDIYYPSQTVTIPASSQFASMYICGPGTTVYDTLDPTAGGKYRIVYVSSGSTYHYKYTLNSNGMSLWAMNGSTVIIYPGTNTGSSFSVDKEPGATITNLSTETITINNCTTITGPPTSYCSTAGISNLNSSNTQIKVWPNPAHDKLFISSERAENKTVSIVNVIGETVYSLKGIRDGKQEVSLSTFAPGIYYVVIKGDGITETKKIVVTR
jgi:hypothetical protein